LAAVEVCLRGLCFLARRGNPKDLLEGFSKTQIQRFRIFTIISAVAQLERDIIAERVRAGLRTPRVNIDISQVKKLRSVVFSLRNIAEEIGVSRTTVMELLKRP
jgi:DNA invertase Pin-like site-specific DNA recombinase